MHGAIQKVVVTSVVMRHFCILSGAPRACADFCDPTAVSRFKGGPKMGWDFVLVILLQALSKRQDNAILISDVLPLEKS